MYLRYVAQNLPQMATNFRNDTDYGRAKIKCLHSLAFVPIQHVYKYFCIILGNHENNAETRCMYSKSKLIEINVAFSPYSILSVNMDRLRPCL